jgi:hypothetical protein
MASLIALLIVEERRHLMSVDGSPSRAARRSDFGEPACQKVSPGGHKSSPKAVHAVLGEFQVHASRRCQLIALYLLCAHPRHA